MLVIPVKIKKPTFLRLLPENSGIRNDAFDVTSAALVTGLITARVALGECDLLELFQNTILFLPDCYSV